MAQHDLKSEQPPAPILSLDDRTWSRIVDSLRLSPQQARIVALILRGFCDKQIAAELRLTVPTVRTYLSRIFLRAGVSDRLALVLRAFSVAQATWTHDPCHHQ